MGFTTHGAKVANIPGVGKHLSKSLRSFGLDGIGSTFAAEIKPEVDMEENFDRRQVEFNKCQTPLEKLNLESYALEVQEQFWDYLSNVPFIKWLVSKDRPLVSQLPRDGEGKAIIDVTHPPILEGSDYFRPSAIAYEENNRQYSTLRPNANPNSEFGKWLYEERRRGWEGLIDPDTGMWVTGDYYWMLNYCPMHLIKRGKNGMKIRTVGFPRFWDGQFFATHYLLQARQHGHQAAELASRGKGKTSLGAAMLSRRFILGEAADNQDRIQCWATATDRVKLLGENQVLSVFAENIDFCAKNTQFASHRLTSSRQEMLWRMGFKKSGSDVEYGSKNAVQGIITGVNQDKLNGSRGVLYIIEEAGIFKDLLSMYNLIRPSVEDGSDIYGLLFAYGTAGDEQSDFTAFAEMFYSPKGYNMEALENVYDKEGQGRKTITYFYPAYLNRANCMDENGNSDVTKALLELLADRYSVKYGSSDPNTITKRISQYPITPQEAIIRSHGSIFPVTELNERLNQIDNNPGFYDDVYIGTLVQESSTGEVKFTPTTDMPIRDFPTKDNKLLGALEIYEMPQKDSSGKVPQERYILSSDPFGADGADTMSLGSILVMDLWTDSIVAEYTGRPMFTDDYYEICRKMCIFYNGKLMYENNIRGTFAYFSQHNSLYMLADTPEYLKGKQLIKVIGYGNSSKGIPAIAAIKNYGYTLIRDWLIKPVTRIEKDNNNDEQEVTMPNLYNIRNRALLKELVLWNPDINVDRIMSLVQLMLYREEKMILYQGNLNGAGRNTASSGLENDDFFTRNYKEGNQGTHARGRTAKWLF